MNNNEYLDFLEKVLQEDKKMTDPEKEKFAINFIQLIADIKKNVIVDYPQHISKLDDLDQKCLKIYDNIRINKPYWFENNDARANIFGKFISVVNSTRIGMILANKYFDDDSWIQKFDKEINKRKLEEQLEYINAYDTSLRFSFFQRVFSSFESTLKIIIRHLEKLGPNYPENYKSFITQSLNIVDQEEFLKLIQWIRNSIHNNGMHFPDKSQQAKYSNFNVLYKDYEIQFTFGKSMEFLSWDLTFSIAEDIIDLTEEINNLDLIKNESIIGDPVEEIE